MLAAGARPGAGTQSLGPLLNLRLAQPDTIADLRHLPDYAGVTRRRRRAAHRRRHDACGDRGWRGAGRIGAIMADVARRIAYRPVRNRGTIGGSLAHADPAADWVAVLPALGATAIALGPQGERRIAAAAFVTGHLRDRAAPATSCCAPSRCRCCRPRRAGDTGSSAARWANSPRPLPACWRCPAGRRAPCWPRSTAPPLVIEDAQALMREPAAEAARIVAGVPGLTAWRRALAETALRRAVEMANAP